MNEVLHRERLDNRRDEIEVGCLISFTPRSNAHMRLPKVKPCVIDGGPLEQVGNDVLRLWPHDRLRVRRVISGGVVAEVARQLVLVTDGDFETVPGEGISNSEGGDV